MKQGIKLIPDKEFYKKDYETVFEYRFDKKTNLIPKKNNKLTCIMMTEDRGIIFLQRKYTNKLDTFRFNKGLYIIDNEAIHLSKNGNRISVYLEGISTPMKMSNIEKERIEKEYIELDGSKRKTIIQKIKGLKYDSKILDIICDRKLSENFTKIDEKFKYALITFILVIINLILIGVCIAVSYQYH